MAPFSPQLKVQSAVSCPNLIAERWRHTCFVPDQFEEQQLFVMTKSNTCSRFLGEQKGHHPVPSMRLMSRPWALTRQISCRNATMLKNLLSSSVRWKKQEALHMTFLRDHQDILAFHFRWLQGPALSSHHSLQTSGCLQAGLWGTAYCRDRRALCNAQVTFSHSA